MLRGADRDMLSRMEPNSGETEDDFLGRCMADEETVARFTDEDQRYAVCISKWEGKADGFSPNEAMAREAERGLKWREEHGRGGTEIGVARARDISNRRNLSLDTVKRMRSYFARHEVDKQGQGWSPGEDGYPSAGRIAWALWSGDAGRSWAEKILSREDQKSAVSSFLSHLSAKLAAESDAAILSFLGDCIVAFNRMAASASFKSMRHEEFVHSALEILSNWNSLQVGGVDARAIAAKMVKMLSDWDGPNECLIGKSMGWHRVFGASHGDIGKVAIPVGIFCASPVPAISLAHTLFDLFPKSFRDGPNFSHKSILDRYLPNDSTSNVAYQRIESVMDGIQHKSFSLTLKREPDQDGIFEGYASVFGVVDQGMDVVERGAFAKSLGKRKVKMLWQHEMDKPIGVWEDIYEDERGLFVRGRILKEVEKGREAMALLKAGAIDSMSIGYRTIEAAPEGDGRVRKLLEVDLFEISLVTFPMLPDAKVTNVKSITTERDFERFLRDAGYSRKEATAITLHGFKALLKQRDADEDEAVTEGLSLLMEKLTKFKGVLNGRDQEGRGRG